MAWESIGWGPADLGVGGAGGGAEILMGSGRLFWGKEEEGWETDERVLESNY